MLATQPLCVGGSEGGRVTAAAGRATRSELTVAAGLGHWSRPRDPPPAGRPCPALPCWAPGCALCREVTMSPEQEAVSTGAE